MAGARVRPVRRLEPDAELGCDRLVTLGYAASCPCGYAGPIRSTWAAARADLREHGRERHGRR